MKKILIIDKHPVFRSGLKVLLQELYQNLDIREAQCLDELKTTDTLHLILLGTDRFFWQNPDRYTLQLKQISESSKIIICDDSEVSNLSAFKYSFNTIGVNGYLLKQFSLTEFHNCLVQVEEGKRYIGYETAFQLAITQGNASHEHKPKALTPKKIYGNLEPKKLSKGELKVANYLCMGKRTLQIARETDRKPSTISTIKSNIYKKLSIQNVFQLRKALKYD